LIFCLRHRSCDFCCGAQNPSTSLTNS
jgi:hypothetical protein